VALIMGEQLLRCLMTKQAGHAWSSPAPPAASNEQRCRQCGDSLGSCLIRMSTKAHCLKSLVEVGRLELERSTITKG
jgi:hypothetical protein